MQDNENKIKPKRGRHQRPDTEATQTGIDLFGDESDAKAVPTGIDLYGDEAEAMPVKRKKKKPNKKKKKTSKRKWYNRFGKSKVQRKTHNFFEIEHEDGKTAFRIFGHRLSLPMLVLILFILVLISFILIRDRSLDTQEQQVTVVGLPSRLDGYRMLVISDLNGERFGDSQGTLLRTLNNLKYDAVFFLGDMVGENNDPEPFYELLEGLTKNRPTFFIAGDSDNGPYVKSARGTEGNLSELVLEDWILGAIERGATYVDSPIKFSANKTTVWVAPAEMLNVEAAENLDLWKEQAQQEEEGVKSGLSSDYNSLPVTTYRYRSALKLYNAIKEMSEDDFYITLSHEPPADSFIQSTVLHNIGEDGKYIPAPEIVLAGHYCGGNVRLPFYGALYLPDNSLPRDGWLPEQARVSGLRSVGETQIYTTPGLSANSDIKIPGFRLNNQPTISIITLTSQLPESMLNE